MEILLVALLAIVLAVVWFSKVGRAAPVPARTLRARIVEKTEISQLDGHPFYRLVFEAEQIRAPAYYLVARSRTAALQEDIQTVIDWDLAEVVAEGDFDVRRLEAAAYQQLEGAETTHEDGSYAVVSGTFEGHAVTIVLDIDGSVTFEMESPSKQRPYLSMYFEPQEASSGTLPGHIKSTRLHRARAMTLASEVAAAEEYLAGRSDNAIAMIEELCGSGAHIIADEECISVTVDAQFFDEEVFVLLLKRTVDLALAMDERGPPGGSIVW